MANVNVPFSALPTVTNLTGAEIIPLDQGGTTKTATAQQLAVLAQFIQQTFAVGITSIAGGVDSRILYQATGNLLGEISGVTSDGTSMTISTGNLKMTGGGTGVTTFFVVNATANNFSITVPSPVGFPNITMAVLEANQTWTGQQIFSNIPNLNIYDRSSYAANSTFVQNAIRSSMATVPLAITGGTYSFASLGTGVILTVTTAAGAVTGVSSIVVPGTGWAVGDLFTLQGPSPIFVAGRGNTDAVIRVTTIGAGGAVTGVQIIYGGTGYNNSTYSGATLVTTGFTFVLTGVLSQNVTIIMPNGSNLLNSDQWIFVNNTTGAFTTTVQVSNGADAPTGTGVVVPQGVNGSRSMILQTDGITDVWPAIPYAPASVIAEYFTSAVNVNFNAAGDNNIIVPLPPGFTRIGNVQVIISGASANISTGTFGLFTAAGGLGTAIIAAGAAITVTTAADNTNANMQTANQVNSGVESFLPVSNTVYFRVGTTVAGTANVQIKYSPLP